MTTATLLPRAELVTLLNLVLILEAMQEAREGAAETMKWTLEMRKPVLGIKLRRTGF